MSRACTVCQHAERDAIDRALVGGTPNRALSTQHSLTESAIRRHKASHLSPVLQQSHKAAEVERGESLVNQVRALQARAVGLLEEAEKQNDIRAACAALRELRGLCDLLTRCFPPEVLEEARRTCWIKSMSDAELDAYILSDGEALALGDPRFRAPMLWRAWWWRRRVSVPFGSGEGRGGLRAKRGIGRAAELTDEILSTPSRAQL
jgi:hypothetical protein